MGSTLAEAVVALGGRVLTEPPVNLPTVIVGPPRTRQDGFCIRAVAQGWRGGIVPAHVALAAASGPANPLAGMLAAGLAVNEAFKHVSGAKAAGRAPVGLSLWRPGADVDWLAPDASEPNLTFLPSRLWLIGLGHLGQAYIWGLSLLPFRIALRGGTGSSGY